MLNYENQFGFRSGRTTTNASMVENKLHPSGKSLDFSKAYITVDHSVLLAELSLRADEINPCSGLPAVCPDLNTRHDWPVKKGLCFVCRDHQSG